jgi:curli production assembly/transport component CsgE
MKFTVSEMNKNGYIKRHVVLKVGLMFKNITVYLIISAFGVSVALAQNISQSDTASSNQSNVINLSDSTEADDNEKLNEFRKAFEDMVDAKENSAVDSTAGPNTAEADPVLNLPGFVLDETRSKMGRDFYALFYQKWDAPGDAANYTITISEKPNFGRGSQVTIMLDYKVIFNARLQPKYEYIDALSQQAVSRTQQIMQQQTSVKQQLSGY